MCVCVRVNPSDTSNSGVRPACRVHQESSRVFFSSFTKTCLAFSQNNEEAKTDTKVTSSVSKICCIGTRVGQKAVK